MKREIILALVFGLLLINFVSGADINVSNFTDSSGVKEKTNQVLEKQVIIPDNLQIITRVLFGLKPADKVDFQTFVILIALWVIIFIFLHSIIILIPFFNKGTSWIGGFIVMLLMGISGGLVLIAKFVLSLSNLFGVLKGWALLSFAISLIILIGLFFLISKGMKMLGLSERVEEMRVVGRNIGVASEVGKIESENLKKE